jgi:O-antigen/teichoic acid export membrane protein
MVGIYTFYANMTNMIEIFVHTTTIIIFSPLLIDTFIKDKSVYFETFNKFTKNIVTYNIFAAILLAVIMYPVLIYVIDKDSYTTHLSSFIVLVAAEMLFNISLIFHYILYVRKNDFAVVKATVAAAFTNILLNFIFIPPLGINGAAFATFLSFLLLVIMKAYYARKQPETKQVMFLQFLFNRKK